MNRAVFKSQSVHWTTPQAVYEQLNAEFAFDLDPCPIGGKEGLQIPWSGRRVFCNPPYGPAISQWLQRAVEAEIAVYLIPARTDTKWFHDLVIPKAQEIRFIRGRLKFGEAKYNAPFPSMIVVYRQEAKILQGGCMTMPISITSVSITAFLQRAESE